MNTPLSFLLPLLRERSDIWLAATAVRQPQGLTTGQRELDGQLHQRGWPLGALTELLCDHPGSGELQLLLPVLAQLSQQGRRLVFIAPPHLPYAPALHRQGVDLAQVLLIEAPTVADQVWAASQVLRADSAGALLLWPTGGAISHPQLRRLQLAAQGSRGLAVVFRPTAAAAAASPAALRIAITATAAACELHLLKQRGGRAGQHLSIPRPDWLTQPDRPAHALPVHPPPHLSENALPPLSRQTWPDRAAPDLAATSGAGLARMVGRIAPQPALVLRQ